METIKHTYTIQWVGPFDSYEAYRDYLKNSEIGSDYFNIYYFQARQDARYNWHRYVGIHTVNDGIEKRLNKSHSHLREFLDCKELKIWIGRLADEKQQKPENVDVIETLLIQAYADDMTENTMKTKSLPPCSVCVINMWFDLDNKLKKCKVDRPFDDVIMYYNEEQIFKRGNLTKF